MAGGGADFEERLDPWANLPDSNTAGSSRTTSAPVRMDHLTDEARERTHLCLALQVFQGSRKVSSSLAARSQREGKEGTNEDLDSQSIAERVDPDERSVSFDTCSDREGR